MANPNWYGIDGIEFIYRGAYSDPQIKFQGVTDTSCMTVEDTMWERWTEEEGRNDLEGFDDYMLENSEEVKDLILLARGEIEY